MDPLLSRRSDVASKELSTIVVLPKMSKEITSSPEGQVWAHLATIGTVISVTYPILETNHGLEHETCPQPCLRCYLELVGLSGKAAKAIWIDERRDGAVIRKPM